MPLASPVWAFGSLMSGSRSSSSRNSSQSGSARRCARLASSSPATVAAASTACRSCQSTTSASKDDAHGEAGTRLPKAPCPARSSQDDVLGVPGGCCGSVWRLLRKRLVRAALIFSPCGPKWGAGRRRVPTPSPPKTAATSAAPSALSSTLPRLSRARAFGHVRERAPPAPPQHGVY